MLSRACDITSLQEMDLDLATRDATLVSDFKTMIKEIIRLKLSPWERCLIPAQNVLTSLLVACDGSTMASSASVYFISTPVLSGPRESNLAVGASQISKFSIPLNEGKASLLGVETLINLIKVIIQHPDVDTAKLNIDVVVDASCLGHLLCPNIVSRTE